MKGKTWLFWGGLIAAAGGVLFQTSYEVQELEEKLASVNRKIVAEQDSIQVLKAEWSFLNDPTRLETLARTHLALQPVEARQFASLDIIPLRPAPVPAPDAAPTPSFPPTNGIPPAGIPMVRAPQAGPAPAVAGLAPAGSGINRAPVAKVPTAPAIEKGAIIPASAPAGAAVAKPAPVKPSTLVPATAKVPAAPTAAPAPGKLPANAPLPALNRPTDVAAAPAKAATPAGVRPDDSLGMLVARLGANR